MSKYIITYTSGTGAKKVFKSHVYKTKEKAKHDLVTFFWYKKIPGAKNARLKKVL